MPPKQQPVRLLKFSSDGEKIAMGSHRGQHGVSAADGDIAGKIAIIKSATGEHLRTIDGNFKGFCWIPESPNLIVFTRDGDQTHAMYDVDAGAIVREFEGNYAIGHPHVDTSGRVLTSIGQASIGKSFTVRAWSIESGQVIDEFSLGAILGSGNVRPPIGGLWNATVGPHGHRVAVGQGGDIRIWDTRTKQEVEPRLPKHERTTDTLAFSDDGDRLFAIVGNDRFTLFDITTKQALPGFSGPFGAMAMSPDEKNIVSCGDRLVIWDVESGLPLITLADAVDGDFVAVDWSPDNQRIAAARNDGTVHIWELSTGSSRAFQNSM